MFNYFRSALFFLSISISLSCFAQQDWKLELRNYRDSIDITFADEEVSILSDEKRKKFSSLPYFPPSEKWRVPVKVKRVKRGKEFQMQTTTDRKPVYRPYARIKFKLHRKKFCLIVYQSPDIQRMPGYEDYLFLPFTDLTNGVESYGGGRYLELRFADLENGVIDFNYAYNPYCAYNPKYSCPIPPPDNHLDIRVEAGVKYQADF